MRRGDVFVVAGGSGYTGKPRPVVIVQDDLFAAIDSVTICPFTSEQADASFVRLVVAASPESGLRIESRLMIDKISTIPKARLGHPIGRLADDDLVRLNRALLIFLGLVTPISLRRRR